MNYQVRRNTEGLKEVVFNLNDTPLLTSASLFQIICEVAIKEFPGVPPMMDFFNFNFEGEKEDIGVVSLKRNFFLSSNLVLVSC